MLFLRMLYGPRDQPFGLTLEEWTAKWWKRVLLSIPSWKTILQRILLARDLLYANTIPTCGSWQVRTGGSADRTVKFLWEGDFVPCETMSLLQILKIPRCLVSENPEADMISFVKSNTDDIVNKHASIDGEAIVNSGQEFRVMTPPFSFLYPPNKYIWC